MQCLHAYFAKALQHPVFRKRKSEGTAGRNRVDPLGEHRESWNVRGVDCETPGWFDPNSKSLQNIPQPGLTCPHPPSARTQSMCRTARWSGRSLTGTVKSSTKSQHNFELRSLFEGSRFPKAERGMCTSEAARQQLFTQVLTHLETLVKKHWFGCKVDHTSTTVNYLKA